MARTYHALAAGDAREATLAALRGATTPRELRKERDAAVGQLERWFPEQPARPETRRPAP